MSVTFSCKQADMQDWPKSKGAEHNQRSDIDVGHALENLGKTTEIR